MAELGLIIKVGLDKDSLKKANQKIGNFLKTGLKAGAVGAAGALATVGAAAGVAAAETIAFADDANKAMELFRRETGLAEESVDAFSSSAKNLFAAGVGAGIDDIAQAMATVNNTMQTGAKETEEITKRALIMRDVFDKDVGESIDAIKVLMDEFGLTSEEAFDFLVTGAQKGLDRNDDLLDSIREYGNLFGDAGFDAGQFFSILESGAEGGVLGTDKIADAVKELGIRLSEGGKDAKQAFSDVVGVSFDDVAAKISTGEAQWADYFDDIIGGLQDIEDPLERNRQQVALFGTQAEDLGVGFSENINTATTSLDDMTGSMDRVIEKNTNIAESMENLRRQMVVALEPAAQELLPLFADGIARVSEFLTEARPVFTDWAADLSTILGPTLESIGESLVRMGVALGLIPENIGPAGSSLETLTSILEGVNSGIMGVADAMEFLAGIIEKAVPIWERIKDISGFSAELTTGAPFQVEEGSVASFIRDTGLFGRGGSLNILGFQGGGVVPGSPGQAVPIIAHAGETITPAGQTGGITININAPVLGVDDLDTKLNVWGQEIIDNVAGAMN